VTSAWLPKTFTTLSGYTRRQLVADLQAGVVVGIVAIPLAIAFAIASGVSPEKGLVTAAVAGFLISGIQTQPRAALERAGKLEEYGRENFVPGIDAALEIAAGHVAALSAPEGAKA